VTTQRWVGSVLLVLAVVVGVVLIGPPATQGPPLDPSSSGPLGTKALVLLLGELGAEVEVTDQGPAGDDEVGLVLTDDLGEARRDDVEGWVEAGGTLVVADPRSPLHPFPVEAGAGLGLVEAPFDATCTVPALESITEVEPPTGSIGYGLTPGAEGCFFRDGSAYLAVTPRGEGSVVAVGGAGLFTNQALGDADNAVLAAALLAPRTGTTIAFLRPPVPGGGDEGLTDLVGDNVKASLAQLGVAFGIYVLWRARRLGSPVAESQPVTLESSELVVAVGNLMQQARHHDEAARLVGDDLRRRLAERLGLGGDAPVAQVAEVAATRTGVPVERLRSALVPPPLTGPEAVVAHAAEAEALHKEIVHA
jgi:hypothetical protein